MVRRAMFLTRVSYSTLQVSLPDGRWEPSEPRQALKRYLPQCRDHHRDLILTPGCPPLLWSWMGLHPFRCPALDEGDVTAMVREILPPPEYLRQDDSGYTDFTTDLRDMGVYRTALWAQPESTLALIMKISPDAPKPAPSLHHSHSAPPSKN